MFVSRAALFPMTPQRIAPGTHAQQLVTPTVSFPRPSPQKVAILDLEKVEFMSPKKALLPHIRASYLSWPKVESKTKQDAGNTSSGTTLVSTPTLTSLGFKYNTEYGLYICSECQSGWPCNGFYSHARGGVISTMVWNVGMSRYENTSKPRRHNFPAPLKVGTHHATLNEKTVQEQVLKELRLMEIIPIVLFHPKQCTNENREAWLAVTIPKPSQLGPIDGLQMFSHGYKCQTESCKKALFPYCGLREDSMHRHCLYEHKDVPSAKRQIVPEVKVQTFNDTNIWCRYFEVPGSWELEVEAPIQLDTSHIRPLSLKDVLQNEQAALFVDVHDMTGLDMDLINPVYSEIGMKEFWITLDIPTFKPFLDIIQNGGTIITKEIKFLETAVLTTFLETCVTVKRANNAILHLLTQGAA